MTYTDFLDNYAIENTWLTVGIFDGVHLGHQAIIRRLVTGAIQNNSPSVVLTFDPHPAVVLAGKTDFKLLNTPQERYEILKSLGVDIIITETFDRELANQTAAEFMQRLKLRLGLNHMIIGYDTALGKGREGNEARLAELGLELGFHLEVVPPLQNEHGIISSTRIRKSINDGNVTAAALDMGRFFFVTGSVIHGDGRGRTIDLPTANINIPKGKLIPANGIYACWAWVEGIKYKAAVNVGIRPTFTPDLPFPVVEAYLLDFNRDIYGMQMKIEFVHYLRPEGKYSKIEALLQQIKLDILNTRKILG